MDAELVVDMEDRRPLDLNMIQYARCQEALLALGTVAFKAPAKTGSIDEFFSRN